MMQDQSTQTPAEEDACNEEAILGLLLGSDAQRPWTIDEIAREMENPIATEDGLSRLYGAVLVHRCGEFVWATRAALGAAEIAS